MGGAPFRLDVRDEKGVKDDSEVFYLCNQENGAAISRDGEDWGRGHSGGALRDLENLRNLNGDTSEVVQCENGVWGRVLRWRQKFECNQHSIWCIKPWAWWRLSKGCV